MLERFAKLAAVAFIAATLFDGCAYFSKSGRQQLAYERYVRKCSKLRDRQQAKMMKSVRIPAVEPSEPKETSQVGGSPESVSSAGEPAPAQADSPSLQIDSP